MANGILYFGPYNDPGTPTTGHHWDNPHGAECFNPALSVVRSGGTATINLAVRYTGSQASPGDVIVTLYAAGRNVPFTSVTALDTYVQNMIQHSAHTLVAPSPWPPQSIPARSSLIDNYWSPGPVSWTIAPSSATLLVVVATLQSLSLNQLHSMTTPPTQEACVGVWVGP